MSATNAYGSLARAFHWTTAGLLLVQIPLAFYMVPQPLGPAKLGNYAAHKSIGLLIFTVTVIRLAWRLAHPAPPLSAGIPGWQRIVARGTQFFLYVLLCLMPLTGLLRSQAANFQVSVFDLFRVPTFVGADPEWSKSLAAAHELQGEILLALIGAHALAALYHHFIRRDDVLRSMLPRAGRGAA